jgi:hypothetical protein
LRSDEEAISEAKADESFGNHSVGDHLKLCERRERDRLKRVEQALLAGNQPPCASNAARRIQELCTAVFGPVANGGLVAEVARPLRYQRTTALAGALIEACACRCARDLFWTSCHRLHPGA